jgi:hypothetical protein
VCEVCTWRLLLTGWRGFRQVRREPPTVLIHRVMATSWMRSLPIPWFAQFIVATRGRKVDCLLRHEVARLIVWHAGVTRPAVPSAVSYADVRLRRESNMEECRKTSGIQVPDEPLELSVIDHSMG